MAFIIAYVDTGGKPVKKASRDHLADIAELSRWRVEALHCHQLPPLLVRGTMLFLPVPERDLLVLADPLQ